MIIKNKGFTLIELMVVIAIIAILAMVVLVSLTKAREAAEDTKRMTAISQLRSLFYMETKMGEIKSDNLYSFGGGVAEIICEYGDGSSYGVPPGANCPAKGILHIDISDDQKEFCASIKLNEKDASGENKYFCIDKELAAKKYDSDDHRCDEPDHFQCIETVKI